MSNVVDNTVGWERRQPDKTDCEYAKEGARQRDIFRAQSGSYWVDSVSDR